MKSKLIIGVAALIVGLAVPAYFLFSGSSGNSGVVQPSIPTSEAEATFLSLTSQLTPLSFNTGILTDPRFMALVDLHTAIIPEQTGKKDPFAALGR